MHTAANTAVCIFGLIIVFEVTLYLGREVAPFR